MRPAPGPAGNAPPAGDGPDRVKEKAKWQVES
jgi:hypothetical protein